jgi:hypothetical protein
LASWVFSTFLAFSLKVFFIWAGAVEAAASEKIKQRARAQIIFGEKRVLEFFPIVGITFS